jgi:hypothetical protein
MEVLRKFRSLPRGQRMLLWAGLAFLFYTLFGFLAAPPILKYFLKKNLSETLHREVAIEKVRVNPYALSVKVSGFTVREREKPEPFVSFDSLYANLETVSLFRLGVVLKEVRVEAPYVHVARNRDGKYNFSDLIEEFAAKKAPPPGTAQPPEKKPLRFSLNNIQIRNGGVDFDDAPKETRHTVREIRLDIPLLSNFPYHVDTFVQPVLEANVNGTAVSLGGKTRPFKDTHETAFDIDIRKFDIPYYLEYVPFPLNFDIRSAFLNTKGTVTYVQYKDRGPTLGFAGRIAFDNVDVQDPAGKPLLRLPLLDISIASSELISRKVRFSSILVQSPELHMERDRNGTINLASLLPQQKAGETGEERKEGKGEGEKETRVSIEADTVGRFGRGPVPVDPIPRRSRGRTFQQCGTGEVLLQGVDRDGVQRNREGRRGVHREPALLRGGGGAQKRPPEEIFAVLRRPDPVRRRGRGLRSRDAIQRLRDRSGPGDPSFRADAGAAVAPIEKEGGAVRFPGGSRP